MSEYVTVRSKRQFGGFTAMVTVDEGHTDTLTITEHPVEQGAAITDHAFKNPAELMLNVGWSDSGDGDVSVAEIYAQLLELQASREPFDVTTGKRNYKNMLIQSLVTYTDEKTENALMVQVSLHQVIIVETQTVTVPPREVQANPESTAETTNAGTKQVAPAKNANSSALKSIFGDDGDGVEDEG